MSDPSDYYAVLGLKRTATQKQVRTAYKRLARRYHPDKATGDASADAKFKAICEAHDVLSDPHKRAAYDHDGARAVKIPRKQRRTPDHAYTLKVPLAEAYVGGVRRLRIHRKLVCKACAGRGVAPGRPDPPLCSQCYGKCKYVETGKRAPGLFHYQEHPCGTCQRRGYIIPAEDVCTTCSGERYDVGSIVHAVPIPRHVRRGDQMRISGMSDEDVGAVPGDLVVTFDVADSDAASGVSRRVQDGRCNDLIVDYTLTLEEALYGYAIDVPFLGGQTVHLEASGVTQCNHERRVDGLGFGNGAVYVRFQVVLPDPPPERSQR